jgi:hypothetical protein
LLPKPQCNRHRVNSEFGPPPGFIAAPVNLAMMNPAHRNRELVAYLAADSPRLGKADVVWLARLPSADGARLLGDELQVFLVPEATQLAVACVKWLSGSRDS